MKIQIHLLLFFIIISITNSFSQFSETIASDRPGQSNSPITVGKLVLQLQTGLQVGGGKADNYKRNDFELPAIIRFGITIKLNCKHIWD